MDRTGLVEAPGGSDEHFVDLRDYIRLLRRRWRLITLCCLLALGAAAGATYAATPMYTSTTQLFVSAQNGTDVSSAYTGGLFTQQRVKSYSQILSSPQVARLVVEDLQLQQPAESLSREISANAPLDTVLLDVSVTDKDPVRAQQIAASLGRVFPRFVESIEQPQGGGVAPIKVSVVKGSEVPKVPTSPRPKLNLALGLLVGLAVGAGAAVLRESLDTTVKDPNQAAEVVGAPVLGAIAFDSASAKRPLIVHLEPRSPRSEAFRQLRTNLQFVDVDHALKSLVVTSSLPEEGKSTTSCNLAISVAQAGAGVILVEGDLRRPRVADYLGLEGAVGLTSVLMGKVSLEDALQPWGDGSMRVLTSGPLPPNPSELLGSHNMEQVLRQLEAMTGTVVIDAPPLLPVTDAAVLGARASGVLLLVRSGHTTRDQLTRATQTLQAVGANVLGAVLNMVPQAGPDAYHYGYGYYGDGRETRDTMDHDTARAALQPIPATTAPSAPRTESPATPPGNAPSWT